MCYCGNTGVERTPNKESAHKVDWRRKFSRCSCRDSNSQSSDHESGALTRYKLSRNPLLNDAFTTSIPYCFSFDGTLHKSAPGLPPCNLKSLPHVVSPSIRKLTGMCPFSVCTQKAGELGPQIKTHKGIISVAGTGWTDWKG